MPLWLRRTIAFSFVALFLIIAPLLALYSMGYRYHWTKRRFEPTGLITVDGVPANATVMLNGEVRARGLPARMGGLQANTYDLRVEHPRFRAWSATVNVESGRTTVLNGVRLFRDAAPSLVLAGELRAFTVSADRRWAAFVRAEDQAEELWLLNLRTRDPALALRVARAHGETMTATWSPRGALLLVTTPNLGTLVLDPEQSRERTRVDTLLPGAPDRISWELGTNDALVAERAGRFYRIAAHAPRRATLLGAPVPLTPHTVVRNTLYAIAGQELTAAPANGDGAPTAIATLPANTALAAFTDLEGSVLIASTDHGDVVLRVETTTGRMTVVPARARLPSPERNTVLWRTEYELTVADADGAHPVLLERRATPIVDAAWYPDGTHVFSATATDVGAMTLTDVADRRTVTLVNFDDVSALAPDTEGRALFVAARRANDVGLWMLPLE